MSNLELLKALDRLVPEGVELRVIRNTPKTLHFVLPPPPGTPLSDETLAQVAGGFMPAGGTTREHYEIYWRIKNDPNL